MGPGLHPLPTAPRGRLRFAAITGLGCGGLLIVGIPFVVVMLVPMLTRGEDLGRDFPRLFTWPIPLAIAALLLWSGIRSVRGLRRASGDPVPLAAPYVAALVGAELRFPEQYAAPAETIPFAELEVGFEPWRQPKTPLNSKLQVPRQESGQALVLRRVGGRTRKYATSFLAHDADELQALLIDRGARPIAAS